MELMTVLELKTDPTGRVVDKIPLTLERQRWEKRAKQRHDGRWSFPFSQNLFEVPNHVPQSPSNLKDIKFATVKEARDYFIAMHGKTHGEVSCRSKIVEIAKSLGLNIMWS